MIAGSWVCADYSALTRIFLRAFYTAMQYNSGKCQLEKISLQRLDTHTNSSFEHKVLASPIVFD